MVSKKYWKKSIVEFVTLVEKEKEKKNVNILNTSFLVFPGVFSPIYSSDTAWFAEKIIPLIQGKMFLEIGSGTGIIACLAALRGATSVVTTDINRNAIENILENAKLHSLNLPARFGNVFDPIAHGELFDVIFWNHPFYYSEEKISEQDMVSLSVIDNEYQYLKKFFLKGKDHLTKNGQLILGTSNVARINLIKEFAKHEGYSWSLLEKTVVPIYKEKKIQMDLRLYSFKPHKDGKYSS